MAVFFMSRSAVALAFAGVVCLGSMLVKPAHGTVLGGDACSLLTAPQISAVLGVTFAEGEYPISSSMLLCSWTAPSKSRSAGAKVSISLMTERAFDVGKTPSGNLVVTALDEVGEDAYYSAARGVGTRLSVKNRGVCVQIRLEGLAPAKTRAMEKALALEILISR